MRRRTIVSGILGVLVSLLTVLALTGVSEAAPAVPVGTSATPTADIVGVGLVNCAVVTGEIGFSPAIMTAGTATETVSIWFQGTKCSPAPGTKTGPVPTSVVGGMSFTSTENNGCPQLKAIGAGTLNLAYNFPPVPTIMIDPSVAPKVTVTTAGAPPAPWTLAGPVTAGSYPSPGFKASLKPIIVGGQTCANGITSLYITSGTLTNV
jgi:hypothetical protein